MQLCELEDKLDLDHVKLPETILLKTNIIINMAHVIIPFYFLPYVRTTPWRRSRKARCLPVLSFRPGVLV
jgi:hypothetical protein